MFIIDFGIILTFSFSQRPAAINFAIILLAIALTFFISYFVLRASAVIKAFLGKSGISVIQRIMGLLLAALSLQFIIQGLVPLVKIHWV